jgi:3-oxoacyl-[acyl-carrier protein] reductase
MNQQNIVLIGGSSDVGASLISALQVDHARIFIASRNIQSIEGKDLEAYRLESYSFEEVMRAFDQAKDFFGAAPDGVVCLSGSLILKPAHLTSEQEFDECIAANLKAAFATVRAAGKMMTEKGGSVVLISSVAGQMGLNNHEMISAAKAGIEGLVRSAAATYARHKIRFNAVAPGLTSTKLTKRITSSEVALKASTAMHPLGRIGTPDDIARAIRFFLNSENSWMTGQVLGVDGGLSKLKI